jgi:hypothetical protein
VAVADIQRAAEALDVLGEQERARVSVERRSAWMRLIHEVLASRSRNLTAEPERFRLKLMSSAMVISFDACRRREI